MLRVRRLNRCVRWATLLALLLATLAPSVAHALRHARGESMPWSQLCSATGTKRVVFEQPADQRSPLARAHAFEHCPYCALHHDGFAAAPAVAPAELRRDLAGAAPVLLLHAPRPPLAWRAAPARAPPSRA